MKLTETRRVSVHTSWLMALVLTTTLLICHMAFGQVHQMGAGHDSISSATHTVFTEGMSHESAEILTSLTSPIVADSFIVLLVAVLAMFASSRARLFQTRNFAASLLRHTHTITLHMVPRPSLQRARPVFSGVFRL